MAKKYLHSVSLNLEVKSDNEEPTPEELLAAYLDHIEEMKSLKGEDLATYFDVYQTDEE